MAYMRIHGIAAAVACLAVANCGPNGAVQTSTAASTAPAEISSTSSARQSQSASASSTAIPVQVRGCAEAIVSLVGPRLEGVPDSGSTIIYTNGLRQVNDDVVPAINDSRRGDRVRICLVSVPKNCPPGDERGRFYAGTNLRTGESWTAPDSQHMCGGA